MAAPLSAGPGTLSADLLSSTKMCLHWEGGRLSTPPCSTIHCFHHLQGSECLQGGAAMGAWFQRFSAKLPRAQQEQHLVVWSRQHIPGQVLMRACQQCQSQAQPCRWQQVRAWEPQKKLHLAQAWIWVSSVGLGLLGMSMACNAGSYLTCLPAGLQQQAPQQAAMQGRQLGRCTNQSSRWPLQPVLKPFNVSSHSHYPLPCLA